MALNPRTAPDRELVKAYSWLFGLDAAKPVLADLDLFVRGNLHTKITDKEGRIDPFQLAVVEGARRVLDRIQSMASMGDNPAWLKIDKLRQMAAANQKARGQT